MRILNELENIDDELGNENIVIRTDNEAEVKEYGIDSVILVYFEDKIPAIYESDLPNEDKVLGRLTQERETKRDRTSSGNPSV
jgi:hypothetical protein